MKRFILLALLTFFLSAKAQTPTEIYHQLEKLNRFERVLYLAAHPDDENTVAISWLSNDRKAETAYLSLTRGDGGQNLIGPELGATLGVIRTYELMAARSIDGGSQYFCRSVDFGYSKTAEESFEKWHRDSVLKDVVYVIRHFKPDVILTRFPTDSRAGHGHHTASAILAVEGMEKAADETYRPNMLQPHRAQAVYWNASNWWNKNIAEEAANDPDYLSFEIGGFSPLLGMSFNELGSMARTQHKSQGFGVMKERGTRTEYFKRLAGKRFERDFFEDVNRDWTSIGASNGLSDEVSSLLRNFDFTAPEKSVSAMVKIYKKIDALPLSLVRDEKLEILRNAIKASSGLFMELRAEHPTGITGESLEFTLRLLNRSGIEMKPNHVMADGIGLPEVEREFSPLNQNEFSEIDLTGVLYTTPFVPYWIKNPYTDRYYPPAKYTGTEPVGENEICVHVRIEIEGVPVTFSVPAEYVWSDRVKGEQRKPFVTAPRFSANFDKSVYVFPDGKPRPVSLVVKSYTDNLEETLMLELPKGWRSEPAQFKVSLGKYAEQHLRFNVYPGKEEGEFSVIPGNRKGTIVQAQTTLAYEHIPQFTFFTESSVRMVRANIEYAEEWIGYIPGAGDEVGALLEELGYKVDYLTKENFASADLNKYTAIITGIRAYNVHEWLPNAQPRLLEYVKNGGNLIVQYNTATRDLLTNNLGPYPFEISRKRVSVETAPVRFVNPQQTVLLKPNRLTKEDFENWVQERGLYFADELDVRYTPIFSMNDPGEPPQLGSLIVADYGKGKFVYTGISFFRQMPAGVPGAYKLLVNLISYE